MKHIIIEAAEAKVIAAAEAWLRRWSRPPNRGLADTYDLANALAIAIHDLRRARRAVGQTPSKRKAK